MNLRFVRDAVTHEDYDKVAKELPNNFYAWLANKMIKAYPTPKKPTLSIETSFKGIPVKIFSNINGNKLQTVEVAGKRFSSELGKQTVLTNLRKIYSAELYGVLKVDRPDGRTVKSDINELSPRELSKKSLNFPEAFYNLRDYNPEGGKNLARTGDFAKKVAASKILSRSDYNKALEEGLIKESDFDLYPKLAVRRDYNVFSWQGPDFDPVYYAQLIPSSEKERKANAASKRLAYMLALEQRKSKKPVAGIYNDKYVFTINSDGELVKLK